MSRLTRLALGALIGLFSPIAWCEGWTDTFAGTRLDWCRWEDFSQQGGIVTQADALLLSTNGANQFSSARTLSQARFAGDFDVEVRYRRVSGFSPPPAGDGIVALGMGLFWDQARLVQLQRLLARGEDSLAVYSSLPQHAGASMPRIPSGDASGTLRLVRTGTTLKFLYATGTAWQQLGAIAVPATPVHLYLFTLNNVEPRTAVAAFNDFRVNSGVSDDQVEGQGAFFHKRSDFAIAAFTENYPVERYWRQGFTANGLFTQFRAAGFDWSKTSVTTRGAPELAATAPGAWLSQGWKEHYWSSREYAAQTLLDSAQAGLRLEVQLLLSPHAAYWGYQEAPAEWADKSVAETAALVEESAYQTVEYFKSRGLHVERYAIGNEVDIGILDFLPRRRVPVPPGIDSVGDLEWVRTNVWQTEASLLKAAIAGVKRADPAAQVIIHIGGLEFTPGNVFAPAFFAAMRDFGVEYDFAALSHPYPQIPWTLHNYTAACWFKRLARSVARVHDASGKPVMMVEAAYPGRTDPGIVAPPMPDFPYTPAGQAAWVREQLRFASTHPEIVSWHYFYPDMPLELMDRNSPGQVVASVYSVFETVSSPRPALDEFRVNLLPPSQSAVEYYHAALDHYFISALAADIDALDSGHLIGWARTGKSFLTFPTGRDGTSPVCRFYIPPSGGDSHFYSASPLECAEVARRFPSFVEESAEVMDVFLPTTATGACPAGSQPVYRVWNGRADTNHRYTTDIAVRDQMLTRGYVPEGYGPNAVAMCVPR